MKRCPVCSVRMKAVVSAADVAAELRAQEEFVYSRMRVQPSRAELKDLTDFMHGFPAPLIECPRCGLLYRDEDLRQRDAASYEADDNDLDWMQHVYPQYVDAFRKKRHGFEPLLPHHATVIELGSHTGAFLQTAEEWNWNAVGYDIGRDTAEFARRKGFKIEQATLETSCAKAGSQDAIFIWNCFEQLTEPRDVLRAAWRLLKPMGLLTVRVPDAAFYLGTENRLVLAANNLLGFPYLHGYTERALDLLIEAEGFERVAGFTSDLLTLPFADPPRKVMDDRAKAKRIAARLSSVEPLRAPWIELTYAKTGYSTRPYLPALKRRTSTRLSVRSRPGSSRL